MGIEFEDINSRNWLSIVCRSEHWVLILSLRVLLPQNIVYRNAVESSKWMIEESKRDGRMRRIWF
jgi:hypothetical protein